MRDVMRISYPNGASLRRPDPRLPGSPSLGDRPIALSAVSDELRATIDSAAASPQNDVRRESSRIDRGDES